MLDGLNLANITIHCLNTFKNDFLVIYESSFGKNIIAIILFFYT